MSIKIPGSVAVNANVKRIVDDVGAAGGDGLDAITIAAMTTSDISALTTTQLPNMTTTQISALQAMSLSVNALVPAVKKLAGL